MHALLVTFRPEVSEQEFMEKLGPRVKKDLPAAPGLVMKTFIETEDARWGGFYLFDTKENADTYLASDFHQWFSKSPLLSGMDTQHFAVDDGPSQAFGTPTQLLSAASAA